MSSKCKSEYMYEMQNQNKYKSIFYSKVLYHKKIDKKWHLVYIGCITISIVNANLQQESILKGDTLKMYRADHFVEDLLEILIKFILWGLQNAYCLNG